MSSTNQRAAAECEEEEDTAADVQEASVDPLQLSIDAIAAATESTFIKGTIYESEDILISKVRKFADDHYFQAGKRNRGQMKCSRASHSHAKKKAKGEYVLQKKETSLACDCPWMVKWSSGKTTKITDVNPWHNHECDIASKVMSEKKSGKAKHGTSTISTNPKIFRQQVRARQFNDPTMGICPGYQQANLVVLKKEDAFDFLLFCQRNKQACPLLEVLDEGSPHPQIVAPEADLRTDIPKYRIYRNGELEQEVEDCTPFWPEDSVAFLIGCSFSTDGELLAAGIPLRSVEQKKNIGMFKTNIPTIKAGKFQGNLVVSMKPIKATQIALEVEITNKFPQAHGGPICVGCPEAIGISDINKPDWGDSVEIRQDELPVFHACGVTPQQVLMESKVSFAITHSPGHMLVTDLPLRNQNENN